MKAMIAGCWGLCLLGTSCRNSSPVLVQPAFADSLLSRYQSSERVLSSDSDLVFWKNRMDNHPDDYVNGPQYASALVSAFRLHGDIHDLLRADSLILRSNVANQEKEPALFRTLCGLALMQHRFRKADSLLKKAILIEGRTLPNQLTGFDIAFETGDYAGAQKFLQSASEGNSYGYLFRKSKYEHYNSSPDSAIRYMLLAADKAGNNKYLQQAALSNAADLYLHKGDLPSACKLFTKSMSLDASDLHSMLSLGSIALLHDQNESVAEKIFLFVRQHSRSPDALLKLEQLAEQRGDRSAQRKYAIEFASQAGAPEYGQMYSKYLIDLYTGILQDPARATALALEETFNRPTPQVFAWYAWSLFCQHKTEEAYRVFKAYVSARPLEGPELYYMARMMKGLQKGYNAREFFKAAYKNRYDLGPLKIKEIRETLE